MELKCYTAVSSEGRAKEAKEQYWSEVKTGGCLSSQTVTWLFVGVGQAIITYLKEDIQGYLLIYEFGNLTN